jgi:hypothetical protein
MNDLDQVKGLIALGDKDQAVVQLARILLKNRRDLEAWLLMGEIIDDPSRKKDCYSWALKLSPDNVFARTQLQELEQAPSRLETAETQDDIRDTKPAFNKPKQISSHIPNEYLYPTVDKSSDATDVLGYFLIAILAFIVIMYVLLTGNFSSYGNMFCASLFFLAASTGIIIWIVMNKKRS